MAYRINIFELTRQVFNLNGFIPILDAGSNQPVEIDKDQIEVFDSAESIGASVFGTPIFETIAIKHPETGELIYFEDAPIIQVNLEKIIVRSVVTKRPGTVKEFTNVDDYKIKVKGLLVNHDGEAQPFDKIEALRGLLYPSATLEVESLLLQSFDIFSIVIKSFAFKPTAKFSNVTPFEFMAYSETPIELDLDQPSVNIASFPNDPLL